MGKCFSCLKVPPSPPNTSQSIIKEHKDEMVEMNNMFPHNITHPTTVLESHVNGNKKATMTTFNGLGSENYSMSNIMQSNTKMPRGFYSRLPPIGRTGMANINNASIDTRMQKEPSDVKINALFDQYKDPHEDIILAEGIERFCEDLQLNPDDFRVLILAWKLNAEQMCQFTRNEFLTGLKLMKVDSVRGIQLQLPEIAKELETNSELFKDLYRFTFRFGLDVASGQRILPVDMAVVLWKLIFTIREPPLLNRWLKFLECCHVRGIPRDTWNMFLNFAESIGDDLGAYDDTEAWPSIFDDFVEYENDQMNQNVTKDDYIKDMLPEKDS